MAKILIINHYSTNKGDLAQFICMLDTLKKFIPNAEFSVLSNRPEITIKHPAVKYHEVKVLEWIVNTMVGKEVRIPAWAFQNLLWILQSLVWIIFKRWEKVANLFTSSKIRDIMKEYADADIVISCGGGHLTDIHNIMFLIHYYPIFLAIILKKTTMMYAQSVGPFTNKIYDPIYKLMTKFVLNRASLITLRESISRKVLQDLGVDRAPIYVTADSAFPLHPEVKRIKEIMRKEGIIKEEKSPLVGVTLLRWSYLQSSNPELRHEKYKKVMAQAADHLISHLNAKVVFIPMDIASLPGDDRPLALEICQMMKYKDNVNLITGEYTPEDLKGIIGEMEMLIGTRLHSLIFSATMGVPGVSILYDPKAKGIMRMLGQEEFICDINDIEADDLIAKMEEVWRDKNRIKGILRVRVNILRERSLLNAKFAAELLKFAKTHKGEKFLLELRQEEIDLLNAI